MEDFDTDLDELLAIVSLIDKYCYLNNGQNITQPPPVDYCCHYFQFSCAVPLSLMSVT